MSVSISNHLVTAGVPLNYILPGDVSFWSQRSRRECVPYTTKILGDPPHDHLIWVSRVTAALSLEMPPFLHWQIGGVGVGI
jgi:hypothetical protein